MMLTDVMRAVNINEEKERIELQRGQLLVLTFLFTSILTVVEKIGQL